MNLFLIGWRPNGGLGTGETQNALRELVAGLPSPAPGLFEHWSAPSGRLVMACASHRPELVGGVRYVHLEDSRMALFSGRPFRWTADEAADGRAPLDPRFYLAPPAEWLDSLDGRWVAARYDESEGVLELFTDAVGAYPLFWAQATDTRWISNNAELVRRMAGISEPSVLALAGLVATGCTFGSDSPWPGVNRFARGSVVSLSPGRPDRLEHQLPLSAVAEMVGRGFDPHRTARLLVAATGAMADWPGRPAVLQLSGGRDSRLLLAAASQAGVVLKVITYPREPSDVDLATLVCQRAGIELEVQTGDVTTELIAGLDDAVRHLRLTSGAAISLEHAAGYFDPPEGSLPLWINGQGGELARGYYGAGSGDLAQGLFERVVLFPDLLADAGTQALLEVMREATARALDCGAAPKDVPDVLYFERRLPSWAAIGFGCVEYAKGDTVCPLWSRRLLPQQLGPAQSVRRSEAFPVEALRALSPELADIPYADAGPSTSTVPSGFAAVAGRARAAVSSSALVDVLDAAAVKRLLATEVDALDADDERKLWRLATLGLLAD